MRLAAVMNRYGLGSGHGAGRVKEPLVVLSLYLALTLAMTYPVAFSLSSAIPMDPQIKGWYPGDGDPWHYLWAFWYVKRALAVFPPPLLWTDLIYFPLGFEMPFLPGIGVLLLLASGLQLLGTLTLAYNLLWLLSFPLTGFSMYVLGRSLFPQRAVAFLCGLLFMFSSYRMIHATEHLPLVAASFLIPLFTLSLFQVVQQLTTRRASVCALILALSTGISWYGTISLGIFLAVFVWHARSHQPLGRLRVHHLRALAIGLAVFVVTASPFVLPLALHPSVGEIVNRPLTDSYEFAPDLLAFFLPSPRHSLLGAFVAPLYGRFTGNVYEQTVFVGYITLALVIVALLKGAREKRGVFLCSAATFFILALGPLLHINGQSHFAIEGVTISFPLPYLLVHYIPFIKGARVPSRFSEMLIFSLVMVAGYGLSAVASRLRGLRGKGVLYAVLLLGISLEAASVPFPRVATVVPQVYGDIARAPEACSIVEVPLDWRIIKYHYYQVVHGKHLLTGHPVRPRDKYATYPAGVPLIPIFRDPTRLLQAPAPPADRRQAAQLVEFFHICYVIIHREYLDPSAVEGIDQFVQHHFRYRWRQADPALIVYAMRPPASEDTRWPQDYHLDFGAPPQDVVLLTGWSHDEQWGPDLSGRWSNGPDSSLYLFLPQVEDRVLEMRLLPLMYNGSPPQGIGVSVNGTVCEEIRLREGWHRYQVQLPAQVFVQGLNTLRFTYRYTARPRDTIPGASDPRDLAVAFDALTLRSAR